MANKRLPRYKIRCIIRSVFAFVLLPGVYSTPAATDPRFIFSAALKGNACGIIVAHNHPSGNLSANQTDIVVKNKLKEAGKFLEVQPISRSRLL